MSVVENVQDTSGPYTVVWQCEPPEIGRSYRFLSGEWSDDLATVTVWAWEYATPHQP